MASIPDRERNPARTRAAILDAAEKLFAAKGFEATSLNEVGTAAGVSRGTPGYFFGSKADLYQAVLDRSFTEVREAVRAGRARALASNQTPDAILAGAVSDYFDFLAARPNFVLRRAFNPPRRDSVFGALRDNDDGSGRDRRRHSCSSGRRASPPPTGTSGSASCAAAASSTSAARCGAP